MKSCPAHVELESTTGNEFNYGIEWGERSRSDNVYNEDGSVYRPERTLTLYDFSHTTIHFKMANYEQIKQIMNWCLKNNIIPENCTIVYTIPNDAEWGILEAGTLDNIKTLKDIKKYCKKAIKNNTDTGNYNRFVFLDFNPADLKIFKLFCAKM